ATDGISLITTWVGAIFTLIIFSYGLGDNLLYRLAVALFIGVSAGYGCIIAYQSVLYPSLIEPILINPSQGLIKLSIPLLFSLLLLFKLSQRWSALGNPSVALLAGVGAATVIGGAVRGTLFPQIMASINQFDIHLLGKANINPLFGILEGGVVLLGTITTLAFFHFGARSSAQGSLQRPWWIESLSWLGQFFIAVTLGWIYSGVLRAGYVAFFERVRFVIEVILRMLRVI
ncbi:MAG: hypothetical protein ACPL4H_11445, partial [Anaerolineales bacterium]